MTHTTVTAASTQQDRDWSRNTMPPAALHGVDASFERRLIEGIRPIAEHFLASGLHQLFNTGIYDLLAATDTGDGTGATIAHITDALDMNPERLCAFLAYLANEDIVSIEADRVALTARARAYAEFRPWYTVMIGGYSRTLDQLGDALRNGAGPCTRNGRYVGLGSCEMAQFDGMPMTRSLLARAGVQAREVLDLGCGSALYLVDLCRAMPDVTAWGAEPDPDGFQEARSLVASVGMGERIRLVEASAMQFLTDPPAECTPDLIIFGYVLQEVLGQSGEDEVVSLLRSTVDRFPQINIVVIEVAHEVENPSVMRHGLARNFWNLYYLVHPFTNQRLETRQFWEHLFTKAGLSECAAVTTPLNIDSTGVELGYLLRGPRFGDGSAAETATR
jgi:2-ketoarginine methyltransferase